MSSSTYLARCLMDGATAYRIVRIIGSASTEAIYAMLEAHGLYPIRITIVPARDSLDAITADLDASFQIMYMQGGATR